MSGERPYCPLRFGKGDERCIGRECAAAVRLSHPNVSVYKTLWVCGLTSDGEMKHRERHIVESEWRERV